jgi:membrane associated rhomboid family serine protease
MVQKNEHEEWLQQQEQYQYHQSSLVTAPKDFKLQASSIVSNIQHYFVTLHQLSPSLFWTTISCLAVFGMWQVPRFTRRQNSILSKWFVNSRQNTRTTMGASLILSSLSHISPYHLLFNLLALLNFGPSVKRILQQRTRAFTTTDKSMLWPLLVSSAMVSNAAQLWLTTRRGSSSSSLGLSGVTMALAAILARAEPNRTFRVLLLGIIPVSMQARHLLPILMAVSLVGHVWPFQQRGGANIAHMAHLAGLIIGVVYYECGILGLSPGQLTRKVRRQVARKLLQWS